MEDENTQQFFSFIWITCEAFRQEIKETSCFVQPLIQLHLFFFNLTREQGFKRAQKKVRLCFRGIGELLVVKCSEINAIS